ncbi:glycosyltransferase family 2 protein [Vibrio lentus]|uniref:glycosyltransferase family 2 protein n=1 Tax=Vibrio lentus TaxID=136468 RepID=UPI000C82A59D|nr:glycosyltransferase family 2 protein [Vibrio lentus]PMG80864.1 hypothetical protein BCU86_00485 [Vibrio lentus]PMH91299.1 hypothetical protein BCU56_02065 [Vibrio lentus]PMI45308.1 hypothetical protein BCU43_24050 [Vibrio lentus]PMJ03873.1 hypothetical protein BCU32_21115 [Vibrio lentus]PMJ16396.1 hypothetical protein BCU29_00575 [Vibrio lentus]
MNDYPLVSIITPTYNQAEYLPETIESVLLQDYPNIEYIVIDDGSTDNTISVLDKYKGKVRFISHENMGQANTLNKGWSIANGEYLAYLSSDDKLNKNAISELVAAAKEAGIISVVYPDFNLIDDKSNIIRECKTENFDKERMTVDLVCQPGPGALFSRELFYRLSGWNSELRQTPDFDFWIRSVDLATFKRVPKNLAEYRIHESSASFSRMSIERADEIINVMSSYWSGERNNISLSNAYLLSTRQHAQAGRYVLSFKRLVKAFELHPKNIFIFSNWKMIFSGSVRRYVYILKSKIFKA